MENIFLDFTSESGIFKDKEVLRPAYIPAYLPHRKKQIKNLAGALSAALKGETPPNIFIYGKSGVGKTATVKYVSTELEAICKKIDSKCAIVYINAEIFDTQYRVFAYLARVFNKRVPMIGWPTDMVYSEFKDGVDAEKRCVIIILDEVDKLASKGDEALYNLSKINSELNNARLCIICISNDVTFMELQKPGVRASLSEETILFPPYDAYQLRDILVDRAEKAFNISVLDDEVIPLCVAFAAQEHGDVRKALNLLRVSGEIADLTKSKKVHVEHVRRAREHIDEGRITEVVKTLPLQSKLILNSVIRLNSEGGKTHLFSGEVYNTYQNICDHLGIESLTQRRVTDLISELDILGLIDARVVNRGRYGRTKEISLIVPTEYVQSALTGEYDEALLSIKQKAESSTA
ncbi:ORC1-type DNA replication protein [ANME-1 cluster archaeon GoMg2]|nr:ORC1-type DNA replication protein [ANME-1 cluster archaeon GoMg2]